MRRTMIGTLVGLLLLMIPAAANAGGVIEQGKTGDGVWDGSTWSVDIYPGETKTTSISLYNPTIGPLNVVATVIPGSLDNGNLTFELDKSSFTMAGWSYASVTLTVKANGSATPGTYAAQIEIGTEVVPLPPDFPLPPDTTPPIISGIWHCEGGVGETTAQICWSTSEPSTSQVEYWSSPSELSPLSKSFVVEHHVELTGLTPGTTYYYRTMSTDRAGNLTLSDELSFTTSGEPEPEKPVTTRPPIKPEPEPELVEPEPEPELVEPEPEEEAIEPEEESVVAEPLAQAPPAGPNWPLIGIILGLLVVLGGLAWWRVKSRQH